MCNFCSKYCFINTLINNCDTIYSIKVRQLNFIRTSIFILIIILSFILYFPAFSNTWIHLVSYLIFTLFMFGVSLLEIKKIAALHLNQINLSKNYVRGLKFFRGLYPFMIATVVYFAVPLTAFSGPSSNKSPYLPFTRVLTLNIPNILIAILFIFLPYGIVANYLTYKLPAPWRSKLKLVLV